VTGRIQAPYCMEYGYDADAETVLKRCSDTPRFSVKVDLHLWRSRGCYLSSLQNRVSFFFHGSAFIKYFTILD
jgi:hypothetical protein